jgi:LysR family transcriptional activator of nhaA
LDWLNYHHLHYFWVVVQEGSITRASKRLRLSPSTVSAQIRTLEASLGAPLFQRIGRRVELTEAGRRAYRYAEQIFALGREMTVSLRGAERGPALRLTVGVADALPKLVAYRLLEPALRLPEPVHLVCREGRPERLVAELALAELDLVLSDAPSAAPRAYSHLLGESSVSFFGVPSLADRREGFPSSLHGSPFVLPVAGTTLRRSLDRWFDQQNIAPTAVGEFEDGALLSVFGQAGAGIFAAPTVIEDALVSQSGVEVIGRVESIRERFYAISAEREIQHAAVVAITEAARRELFA